MAKLWVFVDFSDKRRFEQIYKTSFQMKLWDKLQKEKVIGTFSVKKMFLKTSQNSQENTFVGVSFSIKLQSSDLNLYWKRDSTQVFSLKFGEIF